MKRKTVYLGMIADIMHPGLINIISEGAKYGDVMIGLYTDKAITTHKRLPYLTYEQRKNVVEHIQGVAQVVPQDDWSYVPNLKKYKPDYIIHGDDWVEGPDKYIREEVFALMKEQGPEGIEDLCQSEDKFTVEYKVGFSERKHTYTLTWNEICRVFLPKLMQDCTEYQMRNAIS